VADATTTATEESDVQRALRVAEAARPGVVRVQWRSSGSDPEVQERNAIVVDSEGLLLMAGPAPSPGGTITASTADGQSTRASVIASDPESALTLLWIRIGGLRPLRVLEVPRPQAPGSDSPPGEPPFEADPLPPGTTIVMTTGTGAIARGTLRAHDRRRHLVAGTAGNLREWTGLDEAAIAAVAEDLGSPWLDLEGRVVGLLVGAVGETEGGARGPERIAPVAAHAVPARTIRVVWPLLRVQRAVPRARLGVLTRPASEALETHVCRGCGGHHVLEVEPGGPAERAGVLRHDVVIAVAGERLRRGQSLQDALLPHRPGDRVALDLVRKGEPLRVEALLASRSE
jgi:S1-C subfamily serine protease